MQVIEHGAQRSRLGFRIHRLTKALAFGKLGIVLLLGVAGIAWRRARARTALFWASAVTLLAIPPITVDVRRRKREYMASISAACAGDLRGHIRVMAICAVDSVQALLDQFEVATRRSTEQQL